MKRYPLGAVDRNRTCMSWGHKILSLARLPVPPRPHIGFFSTHLFYYFCGTFASVVFVFLKKILIGNLKK